MHAALYRVKVRSRPEGAHQARTEVVGHYRIGRTLRTREPVSSSRIRPDITSHPHPDDEHVHLRARESLVREGVVEEGTMQ
jgi:hypothetical protein